MVAILASSSGSFTSDPRWKLVERVADSPFFQKSARLRELLLCICERSLQGRPEELREQRIGQDVFGRGLDFRPNEDNIVRVEARELRRRLEEFFANEGKHEPIVITIPKGAYIASFEPRAALAVLLDGKAASQDKGKEEPQDQAEVVELPAAAASGPELKNTSKLSWTVFFFCTTLVSMVFVGWVLIRDQRYFNRSASRPQVPVQSQPLWAELFDQDHQTSIVYADSTLVLGEQITQSTVLLSDYVNRNYWPRSAKLTPGLESGLKYLQRSEYTSSTDVHLIQQILNANPDFRDRVTLRFARNIQLNDFKSGNFILFGSTFSNPWVQLFEPSLNFRSRVDFQNKRVGFRNMNPKPGEQGEYWAVGSFLQTEQTYSTIALVPNLSRTGSVLMIAGATREGTEAAGECITNPRLSLQMLKGIHALDNGHVRYFEVLLKSVTIAGASKNADIVAYRLLP